MGMIFMGKNNYEPLLEMANTRAELFYQITELVASRYCRANPLQFNGLSEVVVNEDQFCGLVDDFFKTGGERMFYHWAEIATAVYEVIKDRRFEWNWAVNKIPCVPFAPFHTQAFAQYLDSKEVILPRTLINESEKR